MAVSPDRRQEIYDRIKGSSRTEFILEEMNRLGFWNEDVVDFKAAQEFFKEERELSLELSKLVKEKNLISDPEKFLARKHKERKLASKQRQKETKEKREQERLAKAKKWQEAKTKDILYLGTEYSKTLDQKESLSDRLSQQNLPLLQTAEDIASAMGISLGELRFLAFSRKNSKVNHYKRFHIPKKTGGVRLISAPQPKLKRAQLWILEQVLNKVVVHPNAHGCVTGKSIKTNATPHVSKGVVINQDLKNFFPSITYTRIKGVFKSLGYSQQVATIFALLCSEPKVLEVSVLGEDYFAQRGDRFLPQGSPCSPAITNVLCRKMDHRLTGIAKKYGFDYTRYVDDLTFSASADKLDQITNVLKYSRWIVKDENFRLHPEKLRVMKRGGRQEVTGVVVNEKTNINKKSLKRFRALLFQVEKDGLAGKHWNRPNNLLAQIHGYVNFINQIDPEKGAKYKARVDALLEQHGYRQAQQKAVGKKKKPQKKSEQPSTGILGKIKSFFKR